LHRRGRFRARQATQQALKLSLVATSIGLSGLLGYGAARLLNGEGGTLAGPGPAAPALTAAAPAAAFTPPIPAAPLSAESIPIPSTVLPAPSAREVNAAEDLLPETLELEPAAGASGPIAPPAAKPQEPVRAFETVLASLRQTPPPAAMPPAPALPAAVMLPWVAPPPPLGTVLAPVLRPPPPKPAEIGQPIPRERIVAVRRGDTLLSVLRSAGLDFDQARGAVDAVRPLFSPRGLQTGQEVRLLFEPEPPTRALRLSRVRFDASAEKEVRLTRASSGDFVASAVDKPLTLTRARAAGAIQANLFQTGKQGGVPYPVLRQAIQLFSYDVDLQRDLQPGDRFEVIYEQMVDELGRVAKPGNVLFTALDLGDRTLAFYAFTGEDGRSDFYDRSGESIRKALLRTPIDGAEMTSGFGMRMHPLMGYSRMHKGVDFGAPAGTPIYAAGDGVVVEKGVVSGYGNYVRIRHDAEYSTAYAHASRFARGLKVGQRVRQGDVIAFVGSTGRATGPHLHYEVLVDGNQVNPQSIKLAGQKLQGKELKRFLATVADIDRLRNGAQDRVLVAQRP
jgi:murein DD-endopeptidase MepM/ murein hydrolase activator NlpD